MGLYMLVSQEEYLKLLSEYESLPKETQSKSIFDVAGYPHYENVASNILAFFFDPNNEHGLGQLFLVSLLESEVIHRDVRVSREEFTINGGRMDLLIETDSYLIGIENKIYHHLANDLGDYSETLDELARNELNVVKIILCLIKQPESYGFVSVTYEEFFEKIKKRLGSYVSTSSQKWLLYLLDFMSTIENLKGDDMEFDESDRFIIDHVDRIDALIKARENVSKKLYNRVCKLQEEVKKPDTCEKQWIYSKCCLVHDFNLSGNSIAFDLYVSPKRWELQLFGRNIKSQSYLSGLFSISPMSDYKNQVHIKDYRYILHNFKLEDDDSMIKDRLQFWFGLLLEAEKNKNANKEQQPTI